MAIISEIVLKIIIVLSDGNSDELLEEGLVSELLMVNEDSDNGTFGEDFNVANGFCVLKFLGVTTLYQWSMKDQHCYRW